MATVAHFINPFLPQTQGWIHNELANNKEFRPIVLCQHTQNAALFPLRNVFSVFSRYGVRAFLALQLTRLCARYHHQPYLKIITREKPAILHGHFAWESWRNISVIRRTGLPIVTTFYGLDVDKLSRRWIWRRRYQILFQAGSCFICEGPHMASRLAALGCPPEKIKVIYQATDIEKVRRLCAPKDNSRIRILFVGLSRYKKGACDAVQAFINAAGNEPRAELHLIGDGPYRIETQRMLSEAGMLDRATYHGYVDTNTYLSILGTSDLLLAPSKTAPDGDTEGGAPVSVIEALVAGVPVVGTTHSDIPHVVTHGYTGLLCAEGDTQALTNNLRLCIGDESLRAQLARQAWQNACPRHDIRTRVEQINQVYKSLL